MISKKQTSQNHSRVNRQLFTKEEWYLAFAQSVGLECFMIVVILQNTVSVDYILENLVLTNEAFIKLW